MKVALTAPVAEVVPPLVTAAATEPNLTVSGVEARNPLPVMVTLEPTPPLVGLGAPTTSSCTGWSSATR